MALWLRGDLGIDRRIAVDGKLIRAVGVERPNLSIPNS
jgi:hypothetical protein